MRYIGNKTKLLNFIEESVDNTLRDQKITNNESIFYDLFGGTGSVAEHFKSKYSVVCCDNLYSSYIVCFTKLLKKQPEFENLNGIENVFTILNEQSLESFIFQKYSENGDSGRLYFSEENGKKIDGIRNKIAEWKQEKIISENEYYYLLACLIESVHKISNTTGVYGAYLKNMSQNALKTLVIKPINIKNSLLEHSAQYCNSKHLLDKIKKEDIVYLDPPYNNRQYSSNYHLLETIAFGKDPEIKKVKGKESVTGIPNYLNSSDWCKKRKVYQELEQYLQCPAANIFLSYSSEGIMDIDKIIDLFIKYCNKGYVKIFEKKYRRYNSNTTNQEISEYIIALSKSPN